MTDEARAAQQLAAITDNLVSLFADLTKISVAASTAS